MTATATRERPIIFSGPTAHTILAAIPTVQVGRLRSHPSGRGWQIVVDSGDPESAVIDAEGEGLTIEQAEEALDRLDNALAEMKQNTAG